MSVVHGLACLRGGALQNPPINALTRRHANCLSGFTLVELLVSLALLALVAGTIVATFAGGIRVWGRVHEQGGGDQWVQIAFDQLRRDLHRVCHFQPIPFKGDYDAVSFPTLVAVDEETREVGQLGYFFDGARHQLCRSQQSYRQVRRTRFTEHCSPVLEDIDRVQFSYYRFDPETKSHEWVSSWSAEELPLAVTVEIGYRDRSTKQAVTRTMVVDLPLAGPKPDQDAAKRS